MASAATSASSIAQLGKSERAQSLFKHAKKSKAGKPLGNQQQFGALLAAKQATLKHAVAANNTTPPGASGASPTTSSTEPTSATATAQPSAGPGSSFTATA